MVAVTFGEPRRRIQKQVAVDPEPASRTATFSIEGVYRLMRRRAATLKRMEENR